MFNVFKKKSESDIDRVASMIKKADSDIEQLLKKHSIEEVWLIGDTKKCIDRNDEYTHGIRFEKEGKIFRLTRLGIVNKIIQFRMQHIDNPGTDNEQFAEESEDWMPLYKLKQLPGINLESVHLDKTVAWLKKDGAEAWCYSPVLNDIDDFFSGIGEGFPDESEDSALQIVEDLADSADSASQTDVPAEIVESEFMQPTSKDSRDNVEVESITPENESKREFVEEDSMRAANEVSEEVQSIDSEETLLPEPPVPTPQEVASTPSQSIQSIIASSDKMFPLELAQRLIEHYSGKKVAFLAPLPIEETNDRSNPFKNLVRAGFAYLFVDGNMKDLPLYVGGTAQHSVELLTDRTVISGGNVIRYAIAIKHALTHGNEKVIIADYDTLEPIDLNELMLKPINSQEFIENKFDIFVEFYAQYKVELEQAEAAYLLETRLRRQADSHQRRCDEYKDQIQEIKNLAQEERQRAENAEKQAEIEKQARIAAEESERAERERKIEEKEKEQSKTHKKVSFRWRYTYRYSDFNDDPKVFTDFSGGRWIPNEVYLALVTGGENAIKSYIKSEIASRDTSIISAEMYVSG